MDKNRPRLLWTSDWHTDDANVIEYDNRPFRDIKHQNQELVKRFNSVARPQDITYFLGDMGRGICGIINKLNGTHILVVGNHDHIGPYAAIQCGFAAVIYFGAVRLGKHLVTFSHCPLRGIWREDVTGMTNSKPGENWHGESRHQLFSIEDQGHHHLHGHTHKERADAILGKQLDVGVRAHNYFPVTTSFVESRLLHASGSQDDQKTKKSKKNTTAATSN